MRSQNWCLTIPKLVPDDPKTGAWSSQKWCLTIVRHHFWDHFWDPKYGAWRLAVQKSTDQLVATQESDLSSLVQFQHAVSFWTAQIRFPSNHQLSVLFCTVSCGASYLGSQKLSQKWCRTIVRHQFWDHQAPVLGSPGTSFGIVRHQFWDLALIFRVQKGAKTV